MQEDLSPTASPSDHDFSPFADNFRFGREHEFSRDKPSKIREELRLWNEEYGQEKEPATVEIAGDLDRADAVNNITRLGGADDLQVPGETEQDERDEISHITQSPVDDMEDLDPQHRFLRKGDLVELE